MLLLLLAAAVARVSSLNFAFEAIQLSEDDVRSFSAIAFGSTLVTNTTAPQPECRAFPGTPEWPLDDEWAHLNQSIDGALLNPQPPGAPCYAGPFQDASRCRYIISNGSNGRFYVDDPLTVLTAWPQGDTCPVALRPQGTCTQGGFPSYVVNVTTVKQVQGAVNFARNKNLRLVIKNTGHDFVGRSTGAGSLSIWTHYLKSFEFLPQYSLGNYTGMAARVGSGLEAWEMHGYMAMHNMTLVVPSGYTVGPFGGYLLGGGHSLMASVLGLGCDQVLSLQVVTADGRFLTADPDTNSDLYYALRGGGPSTYGVVTSAVVKAHPAIAVTESKLTFTGDFSNSTEPQTNASVEASTVVRDVDTFWRGINLYFADGMRLCDNGATAYSYLTPASNTSLTFDVTFEMPGKTAEEGRAFLQPLFDTLAAAGIALNNTMPVASTSWSNTRNGNGDSPGGTRFASRLFPRHSWEDEGLFAAAMAAIRDSVEAGYTFHGVQVAPTEKAASYPPENGANPAWRTTLMHGDFFDRGVVRNMSAARFFETGARLNSFMDRVRAATPGGGAYVNEADALEPGWQQSFFGYKYARLLRVKRDRDPWGVFWAPKTVGSEALEVRTADGFPSQNGVLCHSRQGSR